jgi:uncharacterized protein YndB with AHSA1/START domain
MNTIDAEATTFRVSKIISAPVERVYKAWTDPNQIKMWFGCDNVKESEITQDLRVGGKYSYVTKAADGTTTTLEGEYKEVVPNKKLVYTWTNNSVEFPAKDTIVTIEFVASGNETEVRIKHSNFALAKSAEGHNAGWGRALENLASFVA